LEKWRTAETSELVDLWEAQIEDMLGVDETSAGAVTAHLAARAERISQLMGELRG
jgi:hypothetical protein